MSVKQTTVVTVDTAIDDTEYFTTINGVVFSINSGVAATVITIAAALVAAITAGAEPVTPTDNVDGTYDLDNSTQNTTFTIKVDFNQSIAGDRLNVNPATELSAIVTINNTWYAIILTRTTTEAEQIQDITHTSAWTEARIKLYLTAIDQASIITSATDDIASVLEGLAYDRTVIIYSLDEENYPEAAWAGLQLPKDPGSTTWKFKSVSGIIVDVLTDTALTNLRAKNCNFYEEVAGVNVFSSEAIVASGEFIDIIRGVDWLQARIEERVYTRLINEEKIPYTNPGIAVIETEVIAQLEESVGVGLITANTAIVTVPDVADVDAGDKASRILRDVDFTAQLAGAIHKVFIQGKLTV